MRELMRLHVAGIKLHWWQRLHLRIALRQHRKYFNDVFVMARAASKPGLAWAEYTRRLYGVPLPPPWWDYDEEESGDAT